MNSGIIQRSWAYKQIHHWTQSCVLTSGAPGDEFMLRSPVTTDLFLKAHGIKILDLLNDPKWSNCLHFEYFNREKHLDIFASDAKLDYTTIESLYQGLCNIVVNDWQHYHLGNTLTWTPLRDLEIFKILLRVPPNELLNQIMSSAISIQLIEQNKPGLSKLISDQKNNHTPMKNLVEFYGM